MTNLRSLLIAAACLKPLLHLSKALKAGLGFLFVLLGLVLSPAAQSDVIWVEDATPTGATLAGTNEGWTWITTNPTPFSGKAHQSGLVNGVHQHYFYAAPAANQLSVNTGDTLFAYVYLDPAKPPAEVMLQWNDGSWNHRAYWGSNNITWGVNGTVSRRYMGPLPAAGQWVRLEVPASLVGLEGRSLNGMAFTLYNGRATWDRAGKASAGSGNVAPSISSVTATPQTLLDNATSQLQVTANDPDAGPAALSYTWSIVSGGGSLSSPTIANPVYTPANVGTSTPVTLNVVVSDGAASVNQNIVLTVNDAGEPITISTSSLADGTAGSPYSQTLTATGGVTPYTWSITTGSLPAGLSLNPAGTISGTPSAAGSSSFTVQVQDNAGSSAIQPLSLVINAVSGSSLYYLYADHLNTPRVITDTSNTVVWRWDSDPFGTDAANEDPDGDGNKFRYNPRFPGQYFDKETGLHYNYFRSSYDPGAGRYGEVDPIGLEGGLNVYGYANQNPMSFTDPTGLTSLVFDVEKGVLTVDPEVLGRKPYDINVTSGKGKCENKPKCEQMPDKGPIPRGNYEIYPSRIDNPSLMNDLRRNFRDERSQGGGDWGDWRVRIYPMPGTNRFGRTGFYLHGGWWDGSAGCIDIGGGIFGNDKLLRDLQRDPNDRIPLLVR